MKAAQIVAPRRIEIVDVPKPSLHGEAPGCVMLRVERACLCGSDSPYFAYDFKDAYPLRVGMSIHECLGTVVESTSDRFQEGDFVLALPFEHQSGLCEYFCTPEDRVVHLPRNAVSREEILVTQPLGTVIWACQKLGNLMGLDAVVVGQGPIGLLFSHLLSNLGARNVIAMDRIDYRLEEAKKMKATHTINVDRDDPINAVREITGGKMADLVVEAVGHQADTLGFCMKLVRRLGTMLLFGVPDDEIYQNFPIANFFRLNLNLISSVGPDVVPNFSLASTLISQGRIDVAPLVSHILPFHDIQTAFELFVDRKDGAIKVFVDYETLN